MMTIEKAWEGYRKLCVDPAAGEAQVRETRAAFYAGFITMLEVNTLISKPGISKARGVMILEQIHQEANRYVRYTKEAAEASRKAKQNETKPS